MTTTDLPRWRTTDLYGGLDAPALTADLTTLADDVSALVTTFDTLDIREGGAVVTPDALETVLDAMNAVTLRAATLRSYLNAFVATDSRDAAAQGLMSTLTTTTLPLGPLRSRFTAWLGDLDDAALDALTGSSDTAGGHAHVLRRAALYARHQMSPAEEDLAARLRPSGAGGWAKLHGNVSAVLSGTLNGEALPVTALRALATDPDEAVRKGAFDAEIAAWASSEVVMAACLNGVKGEEGALAARRGFTDPVQPSLLLNGIDQATLDAMQGAVVRSLPDFRRYFGAKARALGKPKLDWWDLFAPVGRSETAWTYGAGTRFVEEQFRGYSAALGDFAARAFAGEWVDAGPRTGKRSGAFCMRWTGDQSRILMNHDPSLDSVSTLAHELGHAYHNVQLAHLPPLRRETPMTLAETASIFCETIIQNAALDSATGAERVYALETQLLGHAQVVVDIHSRYLFERAVYDKRAERDLNPAEFVELMTWAQRETYGDALGTLHPYMWAVKGHYYSLPFYNYPYTFGLLFGLGLYAQYTAARAQGDGAVQDFQRRYDDLLANTGQATPLELAARFGIDLHAPDFWEGSLDVIRGQIAAYEALTGAEG
ncbi:pepF/M3 family oligoendopeptidase [Deinococcus metalli]|uniref:Oligoendopeptidase F n=1 Tax=Deinococcus metalli TaxID=1141878 RepID=A0A7W8NNT0_9DEIO|nr:M3 family oligoendopeptidase [Deinococcus metalli]MBB5375020.1 pepF/M3 family oligoendopeptidase [Deinococcus metalli]GHF32039.1 oligoendopeptidase F [Deinococcus metalli]